MLLCLPPGLSAHVLNPKCCSGALVINLSTPPLPWWLNLKLAMWGDGKGANATVGMNHHSNFLFGTDSSQNITHISALGDDYRCCARRLGVFFLF